MKPKGNIDELQWVRLSTATIIPRYLFEQIAKREYDIDKLYRYLEVNSAPPPSADTPYNPLFCIEVLVDPQSMIKGVLWFTIDPLTEDILIQIYSVDPHYWGCKGAVLKLAEHLKEIRKKGKLNKIFWITKFPKHSLKYGFKPSKGILMEYMEEEDGTDNDGGSPASGEH